MNGYKSVACTVVGTVAEVVQMMEDVVVASGNMTALYDMLLNFCMAVVGIVSAYGFQ